jgi:mannose-6-phosphate isomerase-like protein (cupin superfamily)
MRKNIWNAKSVKYSGKLTYDDFVTERKDPVVVHFDKPINEGAESKWSYKNLVTKDIGSNIYFAWIKMESAGGHDYHAHSGDEIIYVLQNKLQFAYRSTNGEDKKSVLREGDTVYVPTGTPHSFWNVAEKPCTFLVMKSPPYFLEDIPIDPALRKVKLSGKV